MNSSSGEEIHRVGRWVTVALQHRQVCLGTADDRDSALSYAGIMIVHYAAGQKVSEIWVPLGTDPSEADDEELIQRLRGALLWQAGKQPDTGPTP
jgi:hypothetical protein